MKRKRYTRSVSFNDLILAQLKELTDLTKENVNRMINRLVNEEYIRRIDKEGYKHVGRNQQK